MARCRHRGTWLVAGGSYEWCYQCGAFRATRETGIAQVTPSSPWCSPTGPNGKNPWTLWDKRRKSYQELAQLRADGKTSRLMTEQTPKRLQGDSKREGAWLRNRGYDGLYASGECACEVDDLYPCGERQDDCRPGYKGDCTDACTHEGAGEGNWHISADKPASVDAGATTLEGSQAESAQNLSSLKDGM